jgi:hypothetical protein
MKEVKVWGRTHSRGGVVATSATPVCLTAHRPERPPCLLMGGRSASALLKLVCALPQTALQDLRER